MTAPPRPPRGKEPEALFAEARQHRRRRWSRVVAIGLAAIVAGAVAYGVLAASTDVFGSTGGGGAAAAPVRTVVLLVDVSGSMRAKDVRPTRLDAAVVAMRTFLDRLPGGVETAIVSFSTGAKIELQPTTDRAAAFAALDKLQPEAGTALGTGLAASTELASAALRREGVTRTAGHLVPAAIVLLSDGAQNRGATSPAQAARAAKEAGIRVYGVALGKPGGTVTFGFGAQTSSIAVPPDPATVASIARTTHGRAFTAESAARLEAIYGRLATIIAG